MRILYLALWIATLAAFVPELSDQEFRASALPYEAERFRGEPFHL